MARVQLVRRAFTLIEILVVVAIIALLIAVLVPSLSRAREAGRRSVCGANLHSIGIASLTYQQSNRFPPYFDDGITLRGLTYSYSWSDFLVKGRHLAVDVNAKNIPDPNGTGSFPGTYLAGMVSQRATVFQCPQQKERIWGEVQGIPVTYRADFVATGHEGSLPKAGIYRSPRYYGSSAVIWLGEAFTTHGGIATAEYVRQTQVKVDLNDVNPLRHGGAGMYLFGDGHAIRHASYHLANYNNLGLPWEPPQ